MGIALKARYLFLFLCFWTGQSIAQDTDLEPTWETQKQDAQRLLRPESYRTMMVGTQEVVIVSHEANLPLAKGVILLVSESGRPGASQVGLAPMTGYLNDYGWATILLTAPTLEWQAEPEQETATGSPTDASTEQQSSGEDGQALPVPSFDAPLSINQAMYQRQEQKFMLLMNAAMQEAQNYPGFIVVAAQGTSAAFLAKIYADGQLRAPDAFVSISANLPQKDLNNAVADAIARTPMPVLDIYNQWDNEWTTSTARARKVTAEKALKLHFRQREIVGPAINRQQFQYIAKEIHGWLTYMGW